jgi:hypothetical protein
MQDAETSSPSMLLIERRLKTLFAKVSKPHDDRTRRETILKALPKSSKPIGKQEICCGVKKEVLGTESASYAFFCISTHCGCRYWNKGLDFRPKFSENSA